jgi:hypothetical protein
MPAEELAVKVSATDGWNWTAPLGWTLLMTGTPCARAGCPNNKMPPANPTAINVLNWTGQALMFILKFLRRKINTAAQNLGENPQRGDMYLGEMARMMAA